MKIDSENGLLYELEQKIKPISGWLCALQHVLASGVGIITPPLIIGTTLGLQAWLPYLISVSLLVSGLGTFMQANRWFGVGAGMICLQGTSFAFLGVTLSCGLWLKSTGAPAEKVMAMIFTANLISALVPLLVSRFLHYFTKVITPLVSGTVITLIGLSLIKVSIVNWCGGSGNDHFASPNHIMVGGLTLGLIVFFSLVKWRWLRLSAVLIGMLGGCLLAALQGDWVLQTATKTPLSLPRLFPFGFMFSGQILVPMLLVSLVCVMEAVGDLTANCLISRQAIQGRPFQQRLRGGICADGISCAVAAILGAFPNTTFAQNNGVIQMTGVASRYVGRYIGIILVVLGLIPTIADYVRQIPPAVIGGASMMMCGYVAMAGIRILTQITLSPRRRIIVALALGIGLGIEAEPAFLQAFPLLFRQILGSAATCGGVIAIILQGILPEDKHSTLLPTRKQDENLSRF